MQDPTPIPAAEPKVKTLYAFFRGLFSRMAIGQCVHAALCVAVGAAIGLSTGRTSTALGIVLGVLAAAIGATICALWFRRRVSRPVEQITEVTRAIAGGRYGTELLVQRAEESGADLVIAHYNRITPPRPRAEDDPRPERPTKVQTYGFLMEGPMTKEEFAAGLMQEPASFYYGVMWNKLYRADIVRAHDDIICAEDMDWSEDLYFNLSYIRYAEKFYALSTPIYNYFNTPGSAVHTALNPVNIVATRATLFAYYKELYEHLGLYEEYKPQIYKYLVAVAEA